MNAARGGGFALLLAYAAAMPLVVGGVAAWYLPEIVALFARTTWAVPIFTVVAAVALALALVPSTAAAALAGGLFGAFGLVPAVGAYLLASVALFEVVRRFLQPAVQAAVARSPRGRAAQAELEQATFRIVVLSRLSPVLPFALASVLLGASTVARSTYVAGTLVGMLPRTAAAVGVGIAAERAVAGDGLLGSAVLGVGVLATLGLAWYVGKALRRVDRSRVVGS
ncbi:MAG: TVP38/TMEM64 family protein [Candidatus Rokubacteria bacterium]|nr:TVP38/TMEM64 family protein [Candidatus Rokubacteria bacterium]